MITRYKNKEIYNERWKNSSNEDRLFTYFYNVFVIQSAAMAFEYEFVVYETIFFRRGGKKISLAAFIYSELATNDSI